MSNDKTTLADVQPGRRVRLEEHRGELDPTRIAETVGAREYGVPPYRYFAFTTDQLAAFAAALSAQPSPDGQGDELPALPHPNYPISKTGLQNNLYTASQMQDYARTALAARQPVGEPEIWVSPGQLEELKRRPEGQRSNYLPTRLTSEGNFTQPLYAAPAQAVALGRVRASIQSLLNWIDDWAETPEESGIDAIEIEAAAVLDLIDSHTAGGQP